MGPLDDISVMTIKDLLDKPDHDRSWVKILETFLPVGVADMSQIQRFTGFDREKIRRIIKRFSECGVGVPPILNSLQQTTTRAGFRGRAPNIFLLEETGAALLNLAGHNQVRSCKLDDNNAINHAVLILDIYLDARQAGLNATCDKPIPFGENRNIRPDVLIQLPNGNKFIYEIEQTATPRIIHRIIESIENKIAFFKASRPGMVSTDIRMIINVSPGADYEKTVKIWRQACTIVAQKETLPFKVFVTSLLHFSQHPNFDEKIDFHHWEEITALNVDSPKQEPSKPVRKQAIIPLPKDLVHRSPSEDRLILIALWQLFQESAGTAWGDFPKPDPLFFELIQVIYLASTETCCSPLDEAGLPWASIYLLREYLAMHPKLKELLHRKILQGGTSTRWNPTTILNRMQLVIDAFLIYHGWSSRGTLRAYPKMADWNDEMKNFSVEVKVKNCEILMSNPDGVLPGKYEVLVAQKSLSWVLFALFAYAPYLNLPEAPFW